MARIPSDAAAVIGRNITEARQHAGAKRRELAACAGIEPSTLGRYETGNALPNIETLVRLAYVLGVSPGALFRDVDWKKFPKDREAPIPLEDFLRRRAS